MVKSVLVLGFCLGLGWASAGAARETPPNPRLLLAVPGCPVCDLWLEYEDIVLRAKQEVGPLPHGVLYFYHSDDPAIIEPLIRFAHERSKLAARLSQDAALREALGGPCRHRELAAPVDLQVSTSARGIFAIVTTSDPSTFGWLRDKARMATRSKIPFWF
jgi:hypothetical protein